MSKKKQGGSVRQHVSPKGKRLGVKVSDGQPVSAGEVLVRQRGTKFHAGEGVKAGRDHTLYSIIVGKARFGQKQGKKTLAVHSSRVTDH